MKAVIPLLLICACLHPLDGLQIIGATPKQDAEIRALLVSAMIETGDTHGYLSGDLAIAVVSTRGEVAEYCIPDDSRTVGCHYRSGDGFVIVVLAAGLISFAAHEFCHLGLATYSEPLASACATKVLAY